MDENSNDIDQLFKEAAQHAAVSRTCSTLEGDRAGHHTTQVRPTSEDALSGFVVVVAVVVFLVPLPQLHLFGSSPTRTAKGQHPSTTSSVTAIGQPGGVPAGFEPASASLLSPASGFVLGGVNCPSFGYPAPVRGSARGHDRWRRALALPQGTLHKSLQFCTCAEQRRVRQLSGRVAVQARAVVYPRRRRALAQALPWRGHRGDGGLLGTVYAVVEPSTHGSEELFASPVGRDAWARVGRMTAAGATLAVSGRSAWFVSTSLWTTADGVHWHQYPFRCPGAHYRLASIAAASALTSCPVHRSRCHGQHGQGGVELHERRQDRAPGRAGSVRRHW